jgi:hypothetical protein
MEKRREAEQARDGRLEGKRELEIAEEAERELIAGWRESWASGAECPGF